MISQMGQDPLAASDRKKMGNFEETVYLIKNCVYAFLRRTFCFIYCFKNNLRISMS